MTGARSRRSTLDGDAVLARHEALGEWRFEAAAPFLFCDNEDGAKAAIGEHVVGGAPLDARAGTKCAAHHVLEIDAGASAEIRVRLTASDATVDFDAVFAAPPRGGGRVLRDGHPRRRSPTTARS